MLCYSRKSRLNPLVLDESSVKMRMGREQRRNYYWEVKTEEFEENIVPMPIYSTQITYGLVRRWTQASALRSKEAGNFQIRSSLLVIMWRSAGKSRSQKEIKAIYPSTLRMMCAVPISVIFCSSVADRWSGSNWRFWSNPILIITGTIFIQTFHILLT